MDKSATRTFWYWCRPPERESGAHDPEYARSARWYAGYEKGKSSGKISVWSRPEHAWKFSRRMPFAPSRSPAALTPYADTRAHGGRPDDFGRQSFRRAAATCNNHGRHRHGARHLRAERDRSWAITAPDPDLCKQI